MHKIVVIALFDRRKKFVARNRMHIDINQNIFAVTLFHAHVCFDHRIVGGFDDRKFRQNVFCLAQSAHLFGLPFFDKFCQFSAVE